MTEPTTFTLPYPPSANRYWRNVGGRVLLSKEARQYRLDVAEALAGVFAEPLAGPVYLRMVFYRPQKSGDLDGRLKQPLDALQGIVYGNDNQVVSIYAHRRDDKERPRLEIEVGRVCE